MNRLKSLYVKDFRSIDGEVNVSLDAPIVLIHGPNGAGKTSLLSAIELALTGTVPSLARAEPDYLAYLPHKDRPFGSVRLEVSASDGAVRTADISVTKGKVAGSPILNSADASFFSERSYLAQSTLGRLLEIYQHADKKSDSPLTRFVKELLGLDRMDALISGLHTTGNIARLKVPVPAYGEVREAILQKESEIEELKGEKVQADINLNAQEDGLRQRIAAFDSSLLDLNLTGLIHRLSENGDEEELGALLNARRELEIARRSWASAANEPDSADRMGTNAASQEARSALEKWLSEPGQKVEELLGRAATFFAEVSASSESGYVERGRLLGGRITEDLDRINSLLFSQESKLQNRDDLTRQLSESKSRLARVDRQISGAAEASGSLALTLSELASHIQGDICPVCDRDFAEVTSTPLASHLAAKIAAMVEETGRLQSLTQARISNQAEIARLDQNVSALTSELLPETELSALKTRAADLTELNGRLTNAMPLMQDGDRLRANAKRAAQALVEIQNADQSMIVLRAGLEEMARRFELAVEESLPTEQLLQNLNMTIEQRSAVLTKNQQARKVAIETAENLVVARDHSARLAEKLSTLETALQGLKEQKADADSIINLAKDVVKRTRLARGSIVRRVFNDELNAVWRDLFVRLAPDEPFIPAFAIPTNSVADIEAELETHHRRGGKGGNPRAMLSAGNLNTAALTLFLALHLSVKRKLPWLVVDDPVQSMDEIHIAQFAALLRTLSKQMERQVIIAVHDRSLFDYLSLELSPAFDGDRLNVIELDRNTVGQTTSQWEPRIFVEDQAIAA